MTDKNHTQLSSPVDILKQKKFILGLFLPMQEGAWSPSTAPRSTSWEFSYIAECTKMAETFGFDLVFGLAQWLGKGGYGGDIHFREHEIDPIIASAALAALTKNIVLVNTVHILYAWHPLHLAKFGAALDHISGSRWGINVVTGYKPSEFRMFGLDTIPHDRRYEMAAEFTECLETLWSSNDEVNFSGQFWKMEGAFLAPRPSPGRPLIVNAASSKAGLQYAAKFSDIIFVTSPGGADFKATCDTLPDHIKGIKALAREQFGRDIKTVINPHIICRETEEEARAAYRQILACADPIAAENFYRSFVGGDTNSWRGHTKEQWIIGGNVHLVGSPSQVADMILKLRDAGCDGIQINFFDYKADLEFFGSAVLPLLRHMGL